MAGIERQQLISLAHKLPPSSLESGVFIIIVSRTRSIHKSIRIILLCRAHKKVATRLLQQSIERHAKVHKEVSISSLTNSDETSSDYGRTVIRILFCSLLTFLFFFFSTEVVRVSASNPIFLLPHLVLLSGARMRSLHTPLP